MNLGQVPRQFSVAPFEGGDTVEWNCLLNRVASKVSLEGECEKYSKCLTVVPPMNKTRRGHSLPDSFMGHWSRVQ